MFTPVKCGRPALVDELDGDPFVCRCGSLDPYRASRTNASKE